MRNLFILFYLISTFAYSQEKFVNPLQIPMYLSGSFAELRSNHFHSGIDIKTQEEVGFPVFAVQDGWISRIKVSAWGFGHAIYINHYNGYTSVYAHLGRFNSIISNLALKEQYKNKSFYIDKYFKRNEIKVKQSELIAYSGNTGGSGGPHLHFELRDTKSQEPINPLQFNFDIQDNVPPQFKNLVVYTNGSKIFLKPKLQDNGLYIIKDTILVSDDFKLGIVTRDESNNSKNRLGVNLINYYLDNELMYVFKNKRFSFKETRYANAHIDYKVYKLENKRVQKLYVDPGNLLNSYPISGKYKQLSCGEFNNGIIEIYDSKNNKSILKFVIKRDCSIPKIMQQYKGDIYKYDKDNSFVDDNLRVFIPTGALYSDILFEYKTEVDSEYVENIIYSIHKNTTALQRNIKISIKLPDAKDSYTNKFIIVKKTGEFISAKKTKLVSNVLSISTKEFGDYTIAIDTIPPVVSLKGFNLKNDSKLFIVNISDDLSGISSYNGYVDGEWILFKYDYKNKQIYYDIDNRLVKQNKERMLLIRITDSVGNVSTSEYSFFY